MKAILFTLLSLGSALSHAEVNIELENMRTNALEFVEGRMKVLTSVKRCIETAADVEGIKICRRGIREGGQANQGGKKKGDRALQDKFKKLEGKGD